MRQIFKCIAATAIAACFASCEKSYEELDPQFPAISDGKSVAISSGETVTIDFTLNDVRGNDITVKIDDNAVEDYKVSYTLNSGNDDGTISIAAPAMILDGTPFNVNVTFSDEINNRTASKTVNVTPTVLEGYVKLSEAANSFIVAPGAYVQFPTFKGNSGLKSGAVSLALAWQDAVGLFAEVAQVNESDAIVHFASGKEGNAVINGLDASGNVVWSWLFWVTADAPKDVKVGDFTFQDRNIGALNLDEKSELSVGLVYQYGRKDPFPGIKFGEYATRPVYDASGAEVEIKIVKNTEANNLENAIKNPTIFYNNTYSRGAKHGYSWLTTDATTFGADNFKALWENGGKKSTYDPCPAGYKVASASAWTAVKAATDVKELWDSSYENSDLIGTSEKYAAGNRKKAQFRGCVYDGLRFTITGEINSNSTKFSCVNCVGTLLPRAVVWCSDIDPDYATAPDSYNFRGGVFKVNTIGSGNYDDISAIKVDPLARGNFNLCYAFPARCIKE